MNHSLDGEKIIITGGTSGIGQATALMAAEAGADIIVTGTLVETSNKLKEEMSTVIKTIHSG